jgi:hypothetical protein
LLIRAVVNNQTPEPGSYTLKTSFDGATPLIKNNALTTDFRQHASRDAFQKLYVPGTKKPGMCGPGPGSYDFLNMSIGTEGQKPTIKSRPKNPNGKFSYL